MTGTPRVLLLHGLWMHAPAMRWLAARLRANGFDARPLGYYSVLQSTEAAVARIAAALQPGEHVVAHSLGGLMALQAALQGEAPAGRIVCLGTPLAGSGAARAVQSRVPAGARLIGPHLATLEAGVPRIPEALQVGMVAGRVRRGLGGIVARFEDDHDGTVAVAETRVPGLADHCLVDASHSGLIFSDAAAAQAIAFLRAGRFEHAPGRADV